MAEHQFIQFNKITQMEIELIQTLHPLPNKVNKKISLEKHNRIKTGILAILAETEPTHSELMEALCTSVKDDFVGGVQWYGETVKLDLEAEQLIERTNTTPQKYKLTTVKQ